jgi:hypothetical protein
MLPSSFVRSISNEISPLLLYQKSYKGAFPLVQLFNKISLFQVLRSNNKGIDSIAKIGNTLVAKELSL